MSCLRVQQPYLYRHAEALCQGCSGAKTCSRSCSKFCCGACCRSHVPGRPSRLVACRRCTLAALDKFADTRATFSLEASGGNMTEAIVDVRG